MSVECLDPTGCDQCVLKLLRSHLIEENNGVLDSNHIQHLLAHLNEPAPGDGVFRFFIFGQLQCVTKQANRICGQNPLPFIMPTAKNSFQRLARDQIGRPIELGELVVSKSAQSPEQDGARLIACLFRKPDEAVYFTVREKHRPSSISLDALETLGLTRREAEVLYWVAKEKNNAGIALELGCCQGTIRKHLENIYRKLGVHTRVGAVMAALERLGFCRW